MECAELDGALSVWPVLSWAKGQEHFPAFNSRSARPGRVLQLLEAGDDGGALAAQLSWSGPELERVIHGMLRHLFDIAPAEGASPAARSRWQAIASSI